MSYEQAAREALASASNEEVGYDTIELIHPFFVDEAGAPSSVRFVWGPDDIYGKLENTAPMNPSEVVPFYAVDFDFTAPGVEEGATPSFNIRIGNVDRRIGTSIEQASQNYDPIILLYRPYLQSNLLVGPETDPPYMFEMANVTVDSFMVSGTATLDNVNNFPFPNISYKPSVFKALVR